MGNVSLAGESVALLTEPRVDQIGEEAERNAWWRPVYNPLNRATFRMGIKSR